MEICTTYVANGGTAFDNENDEWINLTRELADLQEKINKISN